jgi:RNA polymerase sigma factor (sigma-70 family)
MATKKVELEKIIEGCVKHDKKSQKELFEMLYGKAMATCMRYIRDNDTAQDVVQESFIKLFKNIESYDGSGSFESWARRFFINSSIDHIRRNKNTVIMEDSERVEDESPYVIDFDVKELDSKEILNAVKSLPDGYRSVFNLYAIEGYSHKEIADMLDISEGTSKSNYHRARKSLVEKLSHLRNN